VSGGHTRDGENEAFIVDRYLESLLARRPLDATDVSPELRATAAALAAGLPRYHPSFRFEESLAARLMASTDHSPAGALIPFPMPAVAADRVDSADRVAGTTAADARPAAIRPAVLGGVLTSAAISLAGAAYVAWRRSRPADPWARAIRAAARRRTA
jgi:hypothetical protein